MSKKDLMIDNEPYEWGSDSITEAQLRDLGDIPDGAQIFQERPGQEDIEITAGMVVSLAAPGIERFSTDSVGSGAG